MSTEKVTHLWERDPNDWYCEPPFCNPALFAAVDFKKPNDHFGTWVVDPFCGRGRVLDAAADAGYDVIGLDRVDRQHLFSRSHPFIPGAFNPANLKLYVRDIYDDEQDFVIVTNPPYNGGSATGARDPDFARELFRSVVMDTGARMTALLLRSKWANGSANSKMLETLPLAKVLAFSPRPSMPPGEFELAVERGELGADGKKLKVGGGTEDFTYYIFDRDHDGPPIFGWLRKPITPREKTS